MIRNVWDWLKQINNIKADPESFSNDDWDKFNSYTLHRTLSMNEDFIELVNEVQKIPLQNKKEIYSVYREFIPKNNKWNKYIKPNIKQHSGDLLQYLSDYFKCSKREVKQYLDFLDDDEILRILNGLGLSQKEINKLLK